MASASVLAGAAAADPGIPASPPTAWRSRRGASRISGGAPQAGELQQDRGRRPARSDNCELSVISPEPVVSIEQRAEPTRVDEAHIAQVDHQAIGSGPSGLGQRTAKRADARNVDLAF